MKISGKKKVYSVEEEAAQRLEDLANIIVDGVPAIRLLDKQPEVAPLVQRELVVKQTKPVPASWAVLA